MTGKTVSDVKFKRSDEAVTLATKSIVSADEELITMDSTLLFQQLLKVAQADPDSLPLCLDIN